MRPASLNLPLPRFLPIYYTASCSRQQFLLRYKDGSPRQVNAFMCQFTVGVSITMESGFWQLLRMTGAWGG
jgi:hypothetical protein